MDEANIDSAPKAQAPGSGFGSPWSTGQIHSDGPRVEEEIWLLGQPSLADYLSHVRKAVEGGADLQTAALVDGWRAANDVYADLEKSEAGIADAVECLDLPDVMAPLAADLSRTAPFRRAFNKMPTTFGMVELDKIVVSQRRVARPFVDALAARLAPRPGPAGLFRFCHPAERRDPPVRMRRLDGQRFLFMSDSNDLRFHETAQLRPEQLSGYEPFGPISAVLGLVIGYGSNFLSVIRSDDRMVLHNGYHRAVALRTAGFTHAPCIIQTVTRRDELELTAASAVAEDAAFYFRAARPPLLKDFFDPRLRTVLRTRRAERYLEVTITVRDYTVYHE
jgi:hypothetical protein